MRNERKPIVDLRRSVLRAQEGVLRHHSGNFLRYLRSYGMAVNNWEVIGVTQSISSPHTRQEPLIIDNYLAHFSMKPWV